MNGRPSSDTLPARPRFNWRDFFRRAGWLESVGIIGVPVVTVVALLAPWITPFDPQLRVAAAYLPPSAAHWFGTDEIGRDLFSRVILGIQYTWLPALAVIGFSVAVGSLVGLISGLIGGKVDLVIQRIIDLFFVVPGTLVALAVVASLGPGLVNTMIAVAIFWWPWYARISRDEIRRLKARPHVEAALIAGVRGRRLLSRYLLPGVVPALLIGASLDVASIIMTLSLMSFLGLGLPAPAPELGAMTARSLDSLTVHWWLPILPAAVIFLLCLLANLAGDGVRAALRGA
ncbi:ABC transporter permease [Mesorhizobium sp. M5C.F.Ca.IN.020.29.1.1]|uniref:ABC transporter permease n=1 Tax=unclassified Mesorhizobium TaxID=325217 RepID=UPI000FCA7E33|nr:MULTISPECIES: ABC transporter permease [unclassified Mesorhizobium]RUV63900.1 ABC transporter permease [Mesorhizobium sp. M5C.F.Ca.IN.020.29.1.1]TIM91093.1 MAG: ABC transporter permease subunit [Mesorhizobium sp.]